MSALFTLLGWFEIGCGLICIPTALFVGPHLLAVAIVSVGLGIGSLTVARGFRSGAKWATWTGAALCAIIVVVASIAIVQATKAAEWDSVAIWASIAAFFTSALIAVYNHRSDFS